MVYNQYDEVYVLSAQNDYISLRSYLQFNELHRKCIINERVDFENEKKWYPAVTDFNMHIDAGEMVALIG